MGWALDERKCISCGACVGVCPAGALDLATHGPVVNEKCTSCGTCEMVCPVRAIKVKS